MVEILIKHGAIDNSRILMSISESPLYLAITNQENDIAKLLIENGAHLESRIREYTGATLLHIAFSKNKLEMANFMITKGAKINSLNFKGISVLQEEILNCNSLNSEIIHHLIESGVDYSCLSEENNILLKKRDVFYDPKRNDPVFMEKINIVKSAVTLRIKKIEEIILSMMPTHEALPFRIIADYIAFPS